MNFKDAAKLGGFISKPYAEDVLVVLANYRDASASEVASRIGLHIKTAQDFLDGLAELGVVTRTEVFERKRPYFRYALAVEKIVMEIDLNQIRARAEEMKADMWVRERKNAGARFSIARHDDAINSVTVWIGNGREREERKLSLTTPQGKFLFHLPFPNAEFEGVEQIMRKANVDISLKPEILDLVQLLNELRVIEVK